MSSASGQEEATESNAEVESESVLDERLQGVGQEGDDVGAQNAAPDSDPPEEEVVPDSEPPDEEAVLDERLQDIGQEGDDVVVEEVEIPPVAEERPEVQLVFYGSARLRLTAREDGDLEIADNNSRVGMAGLKAVAPGLDLFMRVELGTDLGRNLDELLIPGENPPSDTESTFFPRLGFLGFGTQFGDFAVGKQWSSYYDVAGFTDVFAVFGARANGVYNAGTDGGATGTGRPDGALKYVFDHDAWSFSAQWTTGNEIPLNLDDYDYGFGGSVVYEWRPGLDVGFAFNQAVLKELTPELVESGFNGDSQAAVLGLRYATDKWSFAATLARHKNHETTDVGEFIDASGGEVYARYNFNDRFRVVRGLNYLTPDSGDPNAGEFKGRDHILGAQYRYGQTFGSMVFVEVVFRSGRLSDGTPAGDAITIGGRYSLEL